MKAILISIKPEWVVKILNGEKTIEVRKTAPKCELPIEVYIYCTKSKDFLLDRDRNFFVWDKHEHHYLYEFEEEPKEHYFQGKVVAKFTLRKVERFIQGLNEDEYERLPNFALQDYDYHGLECLMEKACINDEEINEYAQDLSFYAWHIEDLIIFDRPQMLCEFHTNVKKEPPEELLCPECGKPMEYYEYKYLSKAPQSWQFVEVE